MTIAKNVGVWGLLTICSASAWPSEVDDLLSLDLQRLLDVEVRVASRRDELAFKLPAALTVISSEQLRASGKRRLADVLRDIPGLHVGRWDGNKWAVSSRNALSRFSSTLQVLVDDRPVYTPLFGGVRWELLDLVTDDIEQIEVIRGPAGPLWGANAVDAVISIRTRDARRSRGNWAYVGLGDGEIERDLELRVGGALGQDAAWRLSYRGLQSGPGRYADTALSTHRGRRVPGVEAIDTGELHHLTFRTDGGDSRSNWSLQSGYVSSRGWEERASATAVRPNKLHYDGGFVQALWTQESPWGQHRVRASHSTLSVRDDILRDEQVIGDLDYQWAWTGETSSLTGGAGWRRYMSHSGPPLVPCSPCFGVWPPRGGDQLLSGFVQYQARITSNVQSTLGAKAERYRPGGRNVQPTARLAWQPQQDWNVWAAVSEGVRSPTRFERDAAFLNTSPALAPFLGCTAYDPSSQVCRAVSQAPALWKARVNEAGLRARLLPTLDIDWTTFETRYTGALGLPIIGGVSSLITSTIQMRGHEVSLRWSPASAWRHELDVSQHRGRELRPGGQRFGVAFLPEWQVAARSRWLPAPDWTLAVSAYWSSDTPRNGTMATLPSQGHLEARVGWRPQKNQEWALRLNNLGRTAGVAYTESLKVNTEAPQSIQISFSHRWP
jgi:iron complex outermembrane receptor protein